MSFSKKCLYNILSDVGTIAAQRTHEWYRWICSFAGYSSHPFQNYFHANPKSYMAWLGAVDRQYPAYLLDLRPPPPHPAPFSVGNPPPPPRWYSLGIVISPAGRIVCLPGHVGGGRSSDSQKGQT